MVMLKSLSFTFGISLMSTPIETCVASFSSGSSNFSGRRKRNMLGLQAKECACGESFASSMKYR